MNEPKNNPEEPKEGPIPDGYIPDADRYMIGSASTPGAKLMSIGGRVTMKLLQEQMRVEHIISIHGVGTIKCILVVDYTVDEIKALIIKARKKILQKSN
jgi:hypothetical protein